MKLTAKTFPTGHELSWAFNITDDDGRVLVRGELKQESSASCLTFTYVQGGPLSASTKLLEAIETAIKWAV